MGFGNFILTQQSKATASRFLKGRRGKKITAHYTRKMYNTVSVCVCRCHGAFSIKSFQPLAACVVLGFLRSVFLLFKLFGLI